MSREENGSGALTGAAGRDCREAPLAIRLLGAWEVQIHGRPLPPLRSRKGQWLLALLVLHRGRAVARDWLAGSLWLDSPTAQSLYNLRRNLSHLRRALGPEAVRFGSLSPHTLTFSLEGADVDVARFDDLVARGDRPSLEEAVRLYRGPLLPECVEEWVVPERTAREQAYLGALETLARQAREREDPEAAARWLRRAVAVEPLHESAQAALMAALAASGDRLAATRVYHEFCRLLQREANTAPGAETTALFQKIRAEARERGTEGVKGGKGEEGKGRRPQSPLTPSPPPPFSPSPPPLAPSPSSLPVPVSSFVGREPELLAVEAALRAARLVTLTGAGGVGKTRLALQLGRQILGDYPDGVWLVELAGLAAGVDMLLVAQTAARALGVGEPSDRPLLEALQAFLQPKRLLLILDNCEHLLDACAPLVAALLESAPELRVLATSRRSLGLTGETDWRVPSLSVPAVVDGQWLMVDGSGRGNPAGPSTINHQPSTLLDSEAVRLFVERGQAAARSFALTPENAEAIVSICRRLDGLPLAIELTAARLKALTVEQIAERLGDRFRLLTSGSRAALPRHQTLHAAIDWSYDLLTEAERALFRQLAVFAGGFTLEAVEAVCGDFGFRMPSGRLDFGLGPAKASDRPQSLTLSPIQNPNATPRGHPAPEIQNDEVLDLLTSLVDQSLVIAEESRYRLLETLREYAAEQWAEDERQAVGRRHARYYLSLVEAPPPGLRLKEALDRLEREHDNLRAAVDWAVGHDEVEVAMRLGAGLGGFWNARGYWREGRERLAAILAVAAAGDARLPPHVLVERAHSLDRAGDLAKMQNDDAAARTLYEEALAIYRRLGDQPGMAWARLHLGEMARCREEFEMARSLLTEALTFFQGLGDRHGVVWSLAHLGELAENEGDRPSARRLYQQCLMTAGAQGKDWGMDFLLQSLGRLAYLDGDWTTAKAFFAESLVVSREAGIRQGMAFAFYMLGSLARLEQQDATAAAYQREAVELFRELGDETSAAGSLAALAFTLQFQGEQEGAAALFKEALLLNEKWGNRRQIAHCLEGLAGVAVGIYAVGRQPSAVGQGGPAVTEGRQPTADSLSAARLFGAAAALREADSPRWPADQADYERNLAALRARLAEEALTVAWAEGAALPLEEAIALALSIG